tara:strand:- start:344 stop:556 length:213 start_codon:yes stop_codon:yes gene_type:complete
MSKKTKKNVYVIYRCDVSNVKAGKVRKYLKTEGKRLGEMFDGDPRVKYHVTTIPIRIGDSSIETMPTYGL